MQFLPVASDLDVEGLDQAIEVEIANIKVHVLRPEHLVATALKVGRPKDYLRILAFLSSEHLDRSALAQVLERHDLWAAWTDCCRKTGLNNPTWVDLRR